MFDRAQGKKTLLRAEELRAVELRAAWCFSSSRREGVVEGSGVESSAVFTELKERRCC